MRGRTWTNSEAKRLREMRRLEYDFEEIAAELDRTPDAVKSYIYYMTAYHGYDRFPRKSRKVA